MNNDITNTYKKQYLPNNDTAERQLLALCLADINVFRRAKSLGISSRSFVVPIHKAVFDAITTVVETFSAWHTIAEELANATVANGRYGEDTWWAGKQDVCKHVINYITLYDETDPSLAQYLCEILKEKERRRELLKISQDAGVFRASDILANSIAYKNAQYIDDILVAPEGFKGGYVVALHFPESRHREAAEMCRALDAMRGAAREEEYRITKAINEMNNHDKNNNDA